MLENLNLRPASVIGPLGEELTLDNLPPPETTRWVSRRKAQVVAAVEGGLLTPAEACARYRMDVDELANWQRLFDHVGVPGLRTTRIQHYRERCPDALLLREGHASGYSAPSCDVAAVEDGRAASQCRS